MRSTANSRDPGSGIRDATNLGSRIPRPASRLGPLYPVFRDLSRDGVAVEAEDFRGIADVSLRLLQGAGDEHLLEFAPRVVIQDSLFEELLHELVELIAHGHTSSRPESNRNASTYFSRLRAITSSGSEGTGGC